MKTLKEFAKFSLTENQNLVAELEEKFDFSEIQKNLESALTKAIGIQVKLGRISVSSGRKGPMVQFISNDLSGSMRPKMFTRLHLTDDGTQFSADVVNITVQYQFQTQQGGTNGLQLGTFSFATTGKLVNSQVFI